MNNTINTQITQFYKDRIFQNEEKGLFVVLDIKELENTIKLYLYPIWLQEEYNKLKQTKSCLCLDNLDPNNLTKIACEIPKNLFTQNFDELLSHKTSKYFGQSIFIKDDNSCKFDYKLYYTNKSLCYFDEPYQICQVVANDEYLIFKIVQSEFIRFCTISQQFHELTHNFDFGHLSLTQTAKKTKELRNQILTLEDKLKFLETNVIQPTWIQFENYVYEDELNITIDYGESVSIRKTKGNSYRITYHNEI